MGKPDQSFTGYIRLKATFWDDPEIEALGIAHAAFYLQMACRIRQLRSDGWITEAQASKLGYAKWRSAIVAMVRLGLLTEQPSATGLPAYYMPAYLKWNYSEEEFEVLRAKKSRAGRKSRCVTLHGADCGCWQEQSATRVQHVLQQNANTGSTYGDGDGDKYFYGGLLDGGGVG